MDYRHKSGSQKRKDAAERGKKIQDEMRLQPSMDKFLRAAKPTTSFEAAEQAQVGESQKGMAGSAMPQPECVEPADDDGVEVDPIIESHRTFDLGTINTETIPSNIIEDFVRHGPSPCPSE